MPEQLTKHPDVTLQVLKSAGAKCGEGVPQSILTACPKQQFCALPGGEVCVYGLNQAREMTQISLADFKTIAAEPLPLPLPRKEGFLNSPTEWVLIVGALAAGVLVGRLSTKGTRL
jgi:hypothetical protein